MFSSAAKNEFFSITAISLYSRYCSCIHPRVIIFWYCLIQKIFVFIQNYVFFTKKTLDIDPISTDNFEVKLHYFEPSFHIIATFD